MKHIREQLINDLNAITEEIVFFDVRGNSKEVARLESYADDYSNQLEILTSIEQKSSGNLIYFNDDGTFRLWHFRVLENGKQVIEYYNVDISIENYDELIEEADCIDVTDTFDIASITHVIIVTDDISNKTTNMYYFVDDDVIEDMRLFVQ